MFNENGKDVKKMPILLNGQTVWVDCVDIEQTKQDKNTMMLDLDLNSTPTSTSGANAQDKPMIGANRTNQINKSKSEFTEQERDAIIKECIEDLISPAELSTRHNISVQAIRTWVKNAGHKLPSRYNTNFKKVKPPGVSSPV